MRSIASNLKSPKGLKYGLWLLFENKLPQFKINDIFYPRHYSVENDPFGLYIKQMYRIKESVSNF